MSVLLRNVTNSIWHAFNALDHDQQNVVNKSKLKVLTANLATLLDLYGVEKGLDHFRSTNTLNFEHFKYYLLQEVFASLPNTISLIELRTYESRIDEVCWLVCRKNYTAPNNYTIIDLNGNIGGFHYKLFRIFCMLGDLITTTDDKQCVLLHNSEASNILQHLLSAMGLDYETDKTYNALNLINESLNFHQFLDLIQFKEYSNKLLECKESIIEAIDELYEIYIKDIIKKGYLLRRGYLLPSLKEYWFILQPCELSYYKNKHQKELSGNIPLDPNCMVRPSATTPSSSGKSDKFLKFVLSTGDRNFELAVLDHRSRLQWMAALQLAITYSTGKEGYQRDMLLRRRQKREVENRKKLEEQTIRTKHLQEVEMARLQLENEKLARLAAETQAKELKIVAIEDSRRVAELEDVKLTLENLLRDETQAKRDEEIVRALQARVLAEEWEKREELELLQEEQHNLLEQERQKRIEFEIKQKEKEQCLRDAEKRLRELEDEREKLDLELKQARLKIVHAEEIKESLESRFQMMNLPKLSDGILGGGGGGGVRRSLSFMHTYRDRPLDIELNRMSTLKNLKVNNKSITINNIDKNNNRNINNNNNNNNNNSKNNSNNHINNNLLLNNMEKK